MRCIMNMPPDVMALQASDFDFELPSELIAQFPLPKRSASRLLCLNAKSQEINHRHFSDLVDLINPNDLLVLNDTQVFPARLYGRKASGGRVECLIERLLPNHQALVQLRASHSPKLGSSLLFADAIEVQVIERVGEFFKLQFPKAVPLLDILNQYAEVPLPPYIHRNPEASDTDRYQTVYAKQVGAVAAPTAGLHFDQALLNQLKAKEGVNIVNVTLHVGAGTFAPVRVEDLAQHKMHSEWMEVSSAVCDAVAQCRQLGGRVIAIGTTSVRCLETAARYGNIQPYQGSTNLFISPGYEFQCVDGLVTNFHLPKSTLLMLVAAFAGYEFAMHSYREAVLERYRFFSYGDASFIVR